MKYFRRRWLWSVLLCLLLVTGSLLSGRSRVESQSPNGIVEVAFSATLTAADGKPIANEYQRVLLNVVSVRLNPTAGAADTDPGWVEIPAPAEVGSTNPVQFITTSLNFGGSGTLLTAATSVLQLDLMPLQNLPFFFNAAEVIGGTYQQAEIVLNDVVPANAVPLCQGGSSEGCIAYPAFLTQSALLSVPITGGYSVFPGAVQPLVINVNVAVLPPPPNSPPSGFAGITPVISVQANTSNATFSPTLGAVKGVVTNGNLSTTIVTAELSGTNQIVLATHLNPDGSFTMNLPALPAQTGDTNCSTPQSGTLYDLYVSGNSGYVVKSRIRVCSQGTASVPPIVNLGTLAIPFSSFGMVTGTIADACNDAPVQGATLQLLVPDTSSGSHGTSCDLIGNPPHVPHNCVAVATAATDDQGSYPVAGTPLSQVAVFPPPGVQHYDLEITAPGYNTTVMPIAAGSVFCPTSRFPNSCSFILGHGFLAGAISTPNFTANRLDALVIAEDSGTNNIENVTLATVPSGSSSAPFTMPVPLSQSSAFTIGVNNYDVFASVQDLFGGAPQKTSGHQIGVAASVGSPSAECSTASNVTVSPMFCVGLGSVFGNVQKANPGTTSVRLSKTSDGVHNVQLMQTEADSIGLAPPPAGAPAGNIYNFCAPSDTYTLTHYEGAAPQPCPPNTTCKIPLVPPPSLGAGCPSICQNAVGSCLLCQPTNGPTL